MNFRLHWTDPTDSDRSFVVEIDGSSFTIQRANLVEGLYAERLFANRANYFHHQKDWSHLASADPPGGKQAWDVCGPTIKCDTPSPPR